MRERRKIVGVDRADADFDRACSLGFQEGCANRSLPDRTRAQLAPATPRDYPVILKTGKGDLGSATLPDLLTRACESGFPEGCGDLGGLYITGQGVPRDLAQARGLFERACTEGFPGGCSNLGLMYYRGDGIPKDTTKGLAYLKQACDLGSTRACEWYAEQPK